MALIECPECKRSISSQAHACPHCGVPIQSSINTNFNEKIEKVNDFLEGIQKFKLIIKYNYPKVALILLFISLFVIPLASDRSGFFPLIVFPIRLLKSNNDNAIYMALMYLFPFVYNLKQMIISYRSSKIMDVRLGDLVVVIAMFSITIMTYFVLENLDKDSISNIGIAVILILSFLVFVGFVKSFELKRKEIGFGEVLKSLFRKSIVDSVSFYLVSLLLILRYGLGITNSKTLIFLILFSTILIFLRWVTFIKRKLIVNYFKKNQMINYISVLMLIFSVLFGIIAENIEGINLRIDGSPTGSILFIILILLIFFTAFISIIALRKSPIVIPLIILLFSGWILINSVPEIVNGVKNLNYISDNESFLNNYYLKKEINSFTPFEKKFLISYLKEEEKKCYDLAYLWKLEDPQTSTDISNFKTFLLYGIYEVFARNGYKFNNSAIYNYFSNFQWYSPKHKVRYIDLDELEKDLIKRNMKLLEHPPYIEDNSIKLDEEIEQIIRNFSNRIYNEPSKNKFIEKSSKTAVQRRKEARQKALEKGLTKNSNKTIYLKTSAFANLRNKSKETLRVLRNEIYAHHGHSFNSPDLRRYFAKKSWYKEIPGHKVSRQELTEQEYKMIKKIKKIEKTK